MNGHKVSICYNTLNHINNQPFIEQVILFCLEWTFCLTENNNLSKNVSLNMGDMKIDVFCNY